MTSGLEVLDRIDVANDPVIFIDPSGLAGTPGMSDLKASMFLNFVKGLNYVVPVPLELVNPDPYLRSLIKVNPITAIPVLTAMSHFLHDRNTTKLKKDYNVDKISSASA